MMCDTIDILSPAAQLYEKSHLKRLERAYVTQGRQNYRYSIHHISLPISSL